MAAILFQLGPVDLLIAVIAALLLVTFLRGMFRGTRQK
jgi:hypothetical protein